VASPAPGEAQDGGKRRVGVGGGALRPVEARIPQDAEAGNSSELAVQDGRQR